MDGEGRSYRGFSPGEQPRCAGTDRAAEGLRQAAGRALHGKVRKSRGLKKLCKGVVLWLRGHDEGSRAETAPRCSSSPSTMIAVVAIVREPAEIAIVMVAVVVTDLMMPIFVSLCGSLQSCECKHTNSGRGGQSEDCPVHGETPV